MIIRRLRIASTKVKPIRVRDNGAVLRHSRIGKRVRKKMIFGHSEKLMNKLDI